MNPVARVPSRRCVLKCIAGFVAGGPVAAQSRPTPSLGFSLHVQASGVLRPTLEKVVVKEVLAGSVAERAGLVKGDVVLSIDGTQLAGAEAAQVRPLLSVKPGMTRKLLLRRADGSVIEATLAL